MPLSRLDPERRERLLRLAAAELAEHGIEHASLNRVVARMGMSKSSFYHHVGSKESLVDAVLETFGGQLVELVQPPTESELETNFWDSLEAAAARVARAGEADGVYWQLGRVWHDPGAPERHRGLVTWIAGAIAVGRRVGAVGTDLPVDLQAAIALAVVAATDRWTVEQGQDRAEDLLPAQMAALRRLLGSDDPEA